MGDYWSCSKFAHTLLKKFCIEKPSAATMEEWDQWHQQAKEKNKFVYWLVEDCFNKVQKVIYFPYTSLADFRYYIKKTFVLKKHYLNTKLPRGEWYELDIRILHGLFEELVDFIEIEKAHLHVTFSKEAQAKYNYNWRAKMLDRFGLWRCPQAGLDYLEWEISLTDEDWIEKGQPISRTLQAIAAEEQLALYNWWKNTRPQRKDPYDLSGWTALCEAREFKFGSIFSTDKTEEEQEATKIALDKCQQIENQYDDEDTEMLIRLIKIRQHLWT